MTFFWPWDILIFECRFPGAYYTTTIEGYIPSTGRGVQAATSHCLGQHFAKMYNITVENPTPMKEGESADAYQKRLYVWQNSWGLTTRSIGVMMLIHGDDKVRTGADEMGRC